MSNKVAAFISYGQGGAGVDALLSAGGTGRLAERIKALGVATTLFNWDQPTKIAALIKAMPKTTRIVVGGTSLGANEAPRVGELAAPLAIDFMFGIQPSLYGAKNLVTSNVKRALFFHSPWWWPVTLGFGQYQWQRDPFNHFTTLIAQPTYLPHPGDNAESVHGPILTEIKKLF